MSIEKIEDGCQSIEAERKIMKRKPIQSHLVISVDVGGATPDMAMKHHREITDLSNQIVDLFDRFQIAATWAVADPSNEFQTDRIVTSRQKHEIAILGDAICPNGAANRSFLLSALRKNLSKAESHNVHVESLVGIEVSPENTDVLVRSNISALRTKGQTNWSQPQLVRFGLWNVPESCRFPGTRNWLTEFTKMRFQRMVRTAAARRKSIHLVIDVERIGQSKTAQLKTLEGILSCASRYRDNHELEAKTLGASVHSLTTVPYSQPSKSILRAA